MQNEELLANRIADVMLHSNSFATLNAIGWEAKRDAFITTMIKRVGSDYRHEVIRRVANVEFDIGLEIIKLRD